MVRYWFQKTSKFLFAGYLTFSLAYALPTQPLNTTLNTVEANHTIALAVLTIEKLTKLSIYRDHLHNVLKNSLGILIFPDSWHFGFLLLGFGSMNGILLIKAPNGQWSYPTFWSIYALDTGLKVGIQTAQKIYIFQSGKTLGDTFKINFLWNIGLKGTIGGYGNTISTSATFPPPSGGIIAYGVSRGLYIGVDMGLQFLVENQSLNTAYYQTPHADTKTVIIEGKYKNKSADKLRNLLRQFSQ